MVKEISGFWPGHTSGIGAAGSKPASGRAQLPQVEKGEATFAAVLEAARRQGLKFSAHAEQRLAARKITLAPGEMTRLLAAVEKAAAKGARDSLILMDRLAFVVSVENRTVVTAMDKQSVKDNVFTNIDSAVII